MHAHMYMQRVDVVVELKNRSSRARSSNGTSSTR